MKTQQVPDKTESADSFLEQRNDVVVKTFHAKFSKVGFESNFRPILRLFGSFELWFRLVRHVIRKNLLVGNLFICILKTKECFFKISN